MGEKNMDIARIIREGREKKGLTQMELAALWPIYAQTLNLDAIVFIGYEEYDKALQTFREMNKVAEQLGEPTWIAHSLLTIGVELHRAGYLLRQGDAASNWSARKNARYA